MTESLDTYVVDAGFQSDIGCLRKSNEDSAAIVSPSEDRLRRTKGTLAVVADGMGGHTAGEVASRIATDVLGHFYYASDAEPAMALVEGVREANRAIHEASLHNSELRGMGTTCTAIAIVDQSVVYAHVGDSRLYLIRAGQAYQLSEDHSLVMKMVRDGVLTVEEAREHPERNVILRALGRQAEVEVSRWEQPLPVNGGDHFVLCSDGLYDLVADDEIAEIASAHSSREGCGRLIELCARAGGAGQRERVPACGARPSFGFVRQRLMIGGVVGNYKIVEQIGEGGMGTVYRGVDVMLDRPAAIKSLRPDLSGNPQLLERFRTEAAALAKLNHPGIATLYAFFRHQDDYYMAMEYVEGAALDALLHPQRALLPTPEALTIFRQVVDAIDHAHRSGILHRDIKPANVIVSDGSVAKVTDFGIARILGEAGLTRAGNMIGTIEYIAPERYTGCSGGRALGRLLARDDAV